MDWSRSEGLHQRGFAPRTRAARPAALHIGAAMFLVGSIASASSRAATDAAASDMSSFTLQQPITTTATAAETGSAANGDIKRMTLDELMNIEVSLVSRRPERIAETASAVQVVTGEDIRRSGALTLPEALRLAPNLQVAQVFSHTFAISSRGLNGTASSTSTLANKLLVMIDGRTVYSPLFSGVFWDVQNVLLEDVDRIEVVSGPGGTMWGANAVNGVINIVTKSAKETQGLYLSNAYGSWFKEYHAARYGGKIGDDLYYRVYGFGFNHGSTENAAGNDVNDEWEAKQGGFRVDYFPSTSDAFTVQGDAYRNTLGDPDRTNPITGGPDRQAASGGNVLARWTHEISPKSSFMVQTYFDGTWRDLPDAGYSFAVRTYDIDIQYRFPVGDRHNVLVGGGYRYSADDQTNITLLSFIPGKDSYDIANAFVQDEITLVPDHLTLTLGTKVEHNDFSGWEVQPSARIAYTPVERHTIWAAISRAVRSPTRFDQDVVAPALNGTRGFKAETLIAYELGYRVRPIDAVSLSLAGFYHDYDDIRSANVNAAAPPPLLFDNDQNATSLGFELAADVQASEWWRLRGGYTFMDVNLSPTDPAVAPISETFESNDPRNQVIVQSLMDLPGNFQLDLTGRYVDALGPPAVASYFSLDARVAWHYRNVEFSVVGQNLLDDHHPEFGSAEIPRSVYGMMTLRW